MRLDAGLVFLSDSRTNAGVDAISTARKMTVFEEPGDRVMVLLTSGNLAISQSVRQCLAEARDEKRSLWTARDMFEAVTIVGEAVRAVHKRDAHALREAGIEFSVNLIFGGQIRASARACSMSTRRATSSRPLPRTATSRLARPNMASRSSTVSSRRRCRWARRPSARWSQWIPR
jgi:hypothetical protein